jgi:dihydrofolate reductase
MRKLSMFNNVSLDGYFVDSHGAMDWAHHDDAEWRDFTAGNASGESEMLFGRVTYEMMASFWPTPMAVQMMPDVAKGMNRARKVVFSRTLEETAWENARLAGSDPVAEVARLKAEAGPDLIVMGSGSIVAQLTTARLIDEYQFALIPVILGGGRTLFDGVDAPPALRRTQSRAFENGAMYLRYEAVK